MAGFVRALRYGPARPRPSVLSPGAAILVQPKPDGLTLPPCPYPVTPGLQAIADQLLSSAVNGSWLRGSQYMYLNSAMVPRSQTYNGPLSALYAQVAAQGVGTPEPRLNAWVIGGYLTPQEPSWLWSYVNPALDPFSPQAIGQAGALWQKWAPAGGYTAYAAFSNAQGKPPLPGCPVWSH